MRLTIRIEGINLEKLLRAAQEKGIVLTDAQRMDARSMRVSVEPIRKEALKALCDQYGWQFREERADGMLRAIRWIRRRKMLAAAMALCVLLVYVSSQMILSIQIEHAGENIAEVRRFLDEAGVRPGRMKRAFSLDELRTKLAFRLPGLAFSALRYEGSTLLVDCRPSVLGERMKIPGNEMDIVAVQPGIVTSISASSGTPQVAPGQAVHKGQVLIKGEERTQKGGMYPVQAEGQVKARVFARGEACAGMRETRTVETGQTRTRVTLCTPWSRRIIRDAQPFESQDVSREIQPVVGLYLPLWREIETYAQTSVFDEARTKGDAASLAQGAAEEIAKKQCPYGALILDKWVDYSMIDNEFLYAVVVLEYETSIAGRTQ